MKNLVTLLLFAIFLCQLSSPAQAQEKPLSVGIFVYEGMEILDFAGPSEVFAATPGFKVFIKLSSIFN